MNVMEESEFIAHALRDYMRPLVGDTDIRTIEWCLQAGEPVAAISSALGIAEHLHLALPPIFRDKVLNLSEVLGIERTSFEEQFASLPEYWQKAS